MRGPLLIVGGSGALGTAVARACSAAGIAFRTTSRSGAHTTDTFDPSDGEAFRRIVDEIRPTGLIVTAGQVFGEPNEVRDVTERITANALAVADRVSVVIVGSVAEYGRGPVDGRPSRETDEDDPQSAYGHARVAATEMVRAAHARGLKAVCARVANVVTPLSDPRQPLGEWIAAIRQASNGGTISVGNTLTERDFVTAAEAGGALVTLTGPTSTNELTPHPVVNVSSGRGTSYGALVEAMVRQSGKDLRVEDQGRPLPIRRVVADPGLLWSAYDIRLGSSIDQLAAAAMVNDKPN